MADQAGLIRGRIPPELMFPAGDSRFRTTYLPVKLRTGTVNVRVIECGDPASERIVFCVHGWACSVYSYRILMPLLAAMDIRAIAIDLPGHGLSGKPSDARVYTLDGQVECVLETMNSLGIARAVLVGHSMGGSICARATVVAPERVIALALLAPAGFGTEWGLRVLRALTPRAVAPVLPRLLHRWMVAMVLYNVYGTLYRPVERDIDEYWAPSQFHGFVRAMWDLLHCFEWSSGTNRGFGDIAVPAVIMDGGRDNLVVRRWVKRYAQVLRNASLTVIDDCGHVVPEEAPDLVASAIGALIR